MSACCTGAPAFVRLTTHNSFEMPRGLVLDPLGRLTWKGGQKRVSTCSITNGSKSRHCRLFAPSCLRFWTLCCCLPCAVAPPWLSCCHHANEYCETSLRPYHVHYDDCTADTSLRLECKLCSYGAVGKKALRVTTCRLTFLIVSHLLLDLTS